MTHATNATAATANKQKAINDLILAKENQTEQEFISYKDMVDNQLCDDLESEVHPTIKSFILSEPQLTRVTKRHKANRAYFDS
jgi:deferrochelatase/peroxidase EfeB